jgi:hypothetical protein
MPDLEITSSAQAFTAAQFVLGEIARINALTVEERMARIRADKREGLGFLGGHVDYPLLECGYEAREHVRALVRYLFRTQPSLGGNAAFKTVFDAFVWKFIDQFIRHGRELTPAALSSVLQKSANTLMKKLKDRTIVVPCVLWQSENPPTFKIGPVEFTRAKTFFLAEGNALSKADSPYGERVQKLAEEAGWVASVTVPTIDDDTAEDRARACVDAAISVLKLFLEPHRMRRCRRADTWGPTPTFGLFHRSDTGTLDTSFTMQGHDELGWKNWLDVFQGQLGYLMHIAQSAVAGLVKGRPEYPLQTRLLDALKWFSDGASDASLSARLTKYVFAWERLVITRKHTGDTGDGLTTAVTRRIALLCDRIIGEPTGAELVRKIDYLYDLRSRLSHGSASPWDEREVEAEVGKAEELTVRALMGAMLHYLTLKNGEASDQELESSFKSGDPPAGWHRCGSAPDEPSSA